MRRSNPAWALRSTASLIAALARAVYGRRRISCPELYDATSSFVGRGADDLDLDLCHWSSGFRRREDDPAGDRLAAQGAELPSFTDGSGQKRFVEDVGFAIVRDVAAFLTGAPGQKQGYLRWSWPI
jgi:hypothetical protein